MTSSIKINTKIYVCIAWLSHDGKTGSNLAGNISSRSTAYMPQKVEATYVASGKATMNNTSFTFLIAEFVFGMCVLVPTKSLSAAVAKKSV